MNTHPHQDDSTASPSFRVDPPDSLVARVLYLLSIQPGANAPANESRALRAGRLPLLLAAGGVILALAATVAPTPVFSMMPTAGTSSDAVAARPMQAPADKSAGNEKAVSTEVYDAADVANLRSHLGEFIQVKGTPTGTGQSKTGGVLYLNFSRQRGGAMTVVFFLAKNTAIPASGGGTKPASTEDLKQFVGKEVIVKGQLSDHQGEVQMVLPYLEQIKVQEAK